MKAQEQVPRNALVWMIISLFTLVAPHVGRIPPWVLAVYLLAALWRIMVYRGVWSFPSRLLKTLLIVSGTAGVFVSFGTLVGLEPTVALLLIAFAFKLIELATRKDAYVLLFLAYFICLLQYLFSQDMPVVLYSMINILLVTTALVALHQPGQHQFNRSTVVLAGTMLMQAIPLMLVMFFLFPRIGPLWSVPLQGHSAKTGVSDFMRPGDVSNLSQSADVAFRVEFDGEIPPVSEMYWRGLVFSVTEGGAWRSLKLDEIPRGQSLSRKPYPDGDPLNYSIILEPTQQSWLYSLGYARSYTAGVIPTIDFRLHSITPVREELQYRVSSWTAVTRELELSDWRRTVETRLPADENPRTRELVRRLRPKVSSDAQFVDSVLARFNQQEYVYTLQPPRLRGEHTVDQFLFETREGFCEHFASSFVVMMRAAGIPARVVAGYQGGEVNPVNRTVIIHQFDAHAWAEVWLQGQGWVRVDPTGAVAPGRIRWGLETAMSHEGSFLSNNPLSPLRFRNIDWLNQMRLRYDALTYRWQKWVIGFDGDRQLELLGRVLGEASRQAFAIVILGVFTLVLLPVAISLLYRRRTHRLTALDKSYLDFCDRLARRGVQRQAGETADAFGDRAISELPQLAGQIRQVTRMYSRLAYGGHALDEHRRAAMLRDLKRAVRRLGKREPTVVV
jgi:protein-glutamine gamma-glutamyltransferase